MAVRADALLAALAAAVERHRAAIDGDPTLHQVTVVVTLDRRSGLPREVIWRPESRAEAPGGPSSPRVA